MKHNLTANSLQSNDDSNISIKSELERDEIVAIGDVSYETLVTRRQVLALIPDAPIPVLTFDLDTTESAPYTLTSPQLASVNDFGKYPSFVALISGEVFTDIQPIYTGSPGSFTQVQIKLHDDGTGTNLDDTTVQFS